MSFHYHSIELSRFFLRKIAPAHATHLLACGYDNKNSHGYKKTSKDLTLEVSHLSYKSYFLARSIFTPVKPTNAPCFASLESG